MTLRDHLGPRTPENAALHDELDRLLPCPFCGGGAVVRADMNSYPTVACDACGACSGSGDATGTEAAVRAWNTRAEHDRMLAARAVVLDGFINFVKNAPVSSGVCCCGESMENHSSPMNCGHSPVDQWDYSLSKWLESLVLATTDSTEALDGVIRAMSRRRWRWRETER